jgi:membrane-bound metal-dependent hydrolase YbcI (DUF457 family)
MDLLTHGLLGGLVAQTAGRPQERRLAVGIGFLAALLADADILIRSASDPLLVLEYHRQFSHSLLFIPIGALIASALAWPFVRRRLPPARIYLYAILGYATAGLLDACTSYGTHLFWPFVDRPVSLSIIAVIDPLFTLILLAGVVTVLACVAWYTALPSSTDASFNCFNAASIARLSSRVSTSPASRQIRRRSFRPSVHRRVEQSGVEKRPQRPHPLAK